MAHVTQLKRLARSTGKVEVALPMTFSYGVSDVFSFPVMLLLLIGASAFFIVDTVIPKAASVLHDLGWRMGLAVFVVALSVPMGYIARGDRSSLKTRTKQPAPHGEWWATTRQSWVVFAGDGAQASKALALAYSTTAREPTAQCSGSPGACR